MIIQPRIHIIEIANLRHIRCMQMRHLQYRYANRHIVCCVEILPVLISKVRVFDESE